MADKKLKIAICSHAFNSVDYSVYFNHMWCYAHWAQKYDTILCGKKGLDAATARNALVARAQEYNCTHMFIMDADHVFPLEALDCLTELSDEAMVSGLICKRGEGFQQVGFIKDANGYAPVELPLDGKQYQVSVCAFGCTLINMHHLQKLHKPYFRDICRQTPTGEPYNFRSDIVLCEAFGEIGERCWIDTRVLVGHHGIDSVVYPQSAKALKSAFELAKQLDKPGRGQEGYYYESC